MIAPSTLEDIEQLVANQVQESIHLDYKDSRALQKGAREELTKDVAAFANSDGGVLIYGVREKDHLPVAIDDGVKDADIKREWIESVILNDISPHADGVTIIPIPRDTGRSLYVIEIAKSFRGPHQSLDHKYYKRHNFMSVPMEDYEINDVRSRRKRHEPLVTFDVGFYREFQITFDVTNAGQVVAEDVRFVFSPPIQWPENRPMPHAFTQGIRRLAPKQRIRYRYTTTFAVLGGKEGNPTEFEVIVSYFHPELDCRISDVWPVNFEAYRDSMHQRSEVVSEISEVVESLKKLTETVDKLRGTLEPLRRLAGATGLDLSASTLRNINRLRQSLDPEPIEPHGLDPDAFVEVLGIDWDMAFQIYNTLSYQDRPSGLDSIPGMNEALLEKIRRRFIIRDTTADA